MRSPLRLTLWLAPLSLCACAAHYEGDPPGSDGGSPSTVDAGPAAHQPPAGRDALPGDPLTQACAPQNLVPIQFRQAHDADAVVALAMSYANGPATNLSPLSVGGKTKGYLFVDLAHEIGGFLVVRPSTGATSSEEEAEVRKVLAGIAPVSHPVVQPFKSWDGFDAAIATYDVGVGTGDDLKGRLNRIAESFLGNSVSGLFADGHASAGHQEGWRLQVEVLRRPDQTTLVLGALTTASKVGESGAKAVQRFLLGDVAGGSAPGHARNASKVQSDLGKSVKPKVDFLWVVDDSCSMNPHQTAVAHAADAFVARLKVSQVDYRIALVGTSYWQDNLQGAPAKNYGVVFGFTDQLDEFKGWLKQPCPLDDKTCLGSVQCTGVEKGVESAYDALLHPMGKAKALLPPPGLEEPEDPHRVRRGAKLVIIFVSDAGDQSNGEKKSSGAASDAKDGPYWDSKLGTWTQLFADLAKRPDLDGLMAAAILCSDNSCGETANPSLYDLLVQQTSGVQGAINDDKSVDATMQGIVDAAIGATGMALSKPPISASLKVVQGTPSPLCPQPTPQHPEHGYVYDAVSNRISFFGNCRPEAAGTSIAVSYQYWIDQGIE